MTALPTAPDACPNCNAKWDVAEIPEQDRIHYSGRVRLNRAITVIDTEVGRQVGWMCPDCLGKTVL